MEHVADYLLKSVTQYFNTLRQLGYSKYDNVHKLIIFLYIEEMLSGPMSLFITEEDYNTITKCMYCMFGTSCLLPYPEYLNNIPPVRDVFDNKFRITEDDILRYTQDSDMRVVAK